MGEFVHLHNHSCYSLLDGSVQPKDLVERAAQLDMPAVAMTDHGNLYGAVEFYKQARKKNIKPILGCEVYMAPRSRFQKEAKKDDFQYHLVLLAQNQKGYQNLCKLITAGFLEGFYYKPRIDKELLSQHSEGLIVLSGCVAGEIPSLILNDRKEEAIQVARWYKDLFGEKFFIEIQDHGLEKQKDANEELIQIARRLEIPLVVTNDAHYLHKKDSEMHEILLCIQTQKKISDPERLKFEGEEYYFKSEEEMRSIFKDLPDALSNIQRIVDMIDLELSFDQMLIPPFDVPSTFSSATDYLRHLCYEGVKSRYPDLTPEIRERLDYELKLIHDMGFDNYFLITWDFVRFAKENGILVGPGRGSAAGSIVAYSLGITNLDPLPYGLLFERFLNPERVTMPDIDIDFCYERRDEVLQYVTEKYGSNRVAQIITFGRMAARMSIRDVGRVLDLPYKEVDILAKSVPQGSSIKNALEAVPELKETYSKNRTHKNLLNIAMAIEGLPRHTSTHAAGVVISPGELTDHAPLQRTDEAITTQYDMEALEDLGLLKMDFLGLRTLTIIGKTIQQAKKDIDLDSIPLNDAKTYELLSRGDTAGVFQLESGGMRSVLRELKPARFEEIIAVVALYRPGPMEQIPTYIQNKHSDKSIEYPHPDLVPVLEETYGVMVYQEQIMQVASIIAGFTLGQADVLRRAIGKKKWDVLEGQKDAFIKGASQKYDEQLGRDLFELIERFASYGFNKSHAAAYSLIAYQTAYLKANYPVEFMAALLTEISSDLDKVAAYVLDCQHQGIEVLPPDVNESFNDFIATDSRSIRFGLSVVKNVGEGAVQAIIEARKDSKFQSLYDFCSRVNLSACNRRAVESLIKAGALDSLNRSRAELLYSIDQAYTKGHLVQKNKSSNQMSLLSQISSTEQDIDVAADISEFPYREKLLIEKEMIGLYVSGHPLSEHREAISCMAGIVDIASFKAGTSEREIVVGVIESVKRISTKKGQRMAFFKLSDFSGEIEGVIFPKAYEKHKRSLKEDAVVVVTGRPDRDEENTKLICENISLFPDNPKAVNIYINQKHNRDILLKTKNILTSFPGNIPVYMHIAESKHSLLTGQEFWVQENPKLTKGLTQLLGENAVEVVPLREISMLKKAQ